VVPIIWIGGLVSITWLVHWSLSSLSHGNQGTIQDIKNNLKKLRSWQKNQTRANSKQSYLFVLRRRTPAPDQENDIKKGYYSDNEYDYHKKVYRRKQSDYHRCVESLNKCIFQLKLRLDDCKAKDMSSAEEKEIFYRSQIYYPNGSNMCTPACMMFASAMVGMESCCCPPTTDQMHCIMSSASKVQSLLLKLNQGTSYTMFSIKDVIDHINLPKKYIGMHIVGSVARLPEDFITTFDNESDVKEWITDLYTAICKMKDKSALIMTMRGNAHTVALYREDDQNHWFFDPLVAIVKNFEDRNVALFELFKVIRGTEEFTGFMMSCSN